MKVLHNFPKEVIDVFERLGNVVNEPNSGRYFNLPQWYKKEPSGTFIEVPFKELPDLAKEIHLSYRDNQRVFTLDEVKSILQSYVYAATPNNENMTWQQWLEGHIKFKFGVDIYTDKKPVE